MASVVVANQILTQAHVNHGESLEVTALRSTIPAETEILNYYGPLPSSELVRRYGYVTPEHHRYDVAEIPWSLIRSTLGSFLELPNELLRSIVSYFVPIDRWIYPGNIR